jgi:hypothetical protein
MLDPPDPHDKQISAPSLSACPNPGGRASFVGARALNIGHRLGTDGKGRSRQPRRSLDLRSPPPALDAGAWSIPCETDRGGPGHRRGWNPPPPDAWGIPRPRRRSRAGPPLDRNRRSCRCSHPVQSSLAPAASSAVVRSSSVPFTSRQCNNHHLRDVPTGRDISRACASSGRHGRPRRTIGTSLATRAWANAMASPDAPDNSG